nr:hypothetical protein [Tanacetum cinerariifolium]
MQQCKVFNSGKLLSNVDISSRNTYSNRIDGEFNFLPEGGLDENRQSLSVKSVNNENLVIDLEPMSSVHLLNVGENNIDSDNTSSGEYELPPIGPFVSSYNEKGDKSKAVGKRKITADALGGIILIYMFPSTKELKDATDCHWVVAHFTPPSWKQTHELISTLHKARASYDAIREREGKVNGLHNEYSRLVLEEKNWVNYDKTLSFLRIKVESLESERKRLKTSEIQLLQEIDSLSDEMGILIVKLFKVSITHDRCVVFKEVAKLKEPFILEKVHGYRPSSKEEYD